MVKFFITTALAAFVALCGRRALLCLGLFSAFTLPLFASAKVIAHFSYLRADKPAKKTITEKELKIAYGLIQRSTFNPPSREDFFKDYLRFKMGVEAALHEEKLVESPAIENQITDPYLKQAFHDILYKAFAELKLKKQMESLDKKAKDMPEKLLKSLYAKKPEFNIFYMDIKLPLNPSPDQIQEAQGRAKKIHSQVIKSKKPFLELITLYSDDKINGTLAINRSEANIPPEVYAKLKGMKEGAISSPVRVATGWQIVRLNKKIPFSEANKTLIKANYFNRERSRIFNTYFDKLKKDFKLNVVNRAAIQNI